MTRIFEWFISRMLGVINFFESVRSNRFDDSVVAEYKTKQRTCLLSLVPFIAILIIAWAAGTVLDAISGFSGAQPAVAPYRDGFALCVAAAAGLAVIFAIWAWFSLVAFMKKHQIG